MWFKAYEDYPIDKPLIKYPVEPGFGIIGCEMNEFNGWGSNFHIYKRKKSLLERLITYFSKSEKK